MNQPTHAWIAARAVELLKTEGQVPDLVGLLEPHVKDAAVGAWLPDLGDAKTGSGLTDNHTFKIEQIMEGSAAKNAYFVQEKKELLAALGSGRKICDFLDADESLGSGWWKKPYKANPDPGKHLANRAMAVSTMTVDLLLLGDEEVQKALPGPDKFADSSMDGECKTRPSQVALYFFMLSHFVADACVPMHCDARMLSSSKSGKIHGSLEDRWGDIVSSFFHKSEIGKDEVSKEDVIREALAVDERAGIAFAKRVPGLSSSDVWKEIVFIARASFALACIIAPWETYGQGSRGIPSLKTLFPDSRPLKLEEIDALVLHDAVLNVAIVWKHVWKKFKE